LTAKHYGLSKWKGLYIFASYFMNTLFACLRGYARQTTARFGRGCYSPRGSLQSYGSLTLRIWTSSTSLLARNRTHSKSGRLKPEQSSRQFARGQYLAGLPLLKPRKPKTNKQTQSRDPTPTPTSPPAWKPSPRWLTNSSANNTENPSPKNQFPGLIPTAAAPKTSNLWSGLRFVRPPNRPPRPAIPARQSAQKCPQRPLPLRLRRQIQAVLRKRDAEFRPRKGRLAI